MTYETVTQSSSAAPDVRAPHKVSKKPLSLDEILESFQGIGADVGQISQLASEEKVLVADFFASMQKLLPALSSSIMVSPSIFPTKTGELPQVQIDPSGNLLLTFKNGRRKLVDLSKPENRDLLFAVVGDILPKFKTLTRQITPEKLQDPLQVEEIPAELPAEIPLPTLPELEPELAPEIPIEAPPVDLAEPIPAELPQEPVLEEISEEPLAEEEMLPMPAECALSAEEAAKVATVEAETLEFLSMLGTEVFEQAPVSKYFDDWMVNLRQIILSFESNDLIGPDETFAAEYNQIFGDIEDELAKRLAAEADIAVSAKTLVENRYLLNKIDEGYAAQTKELVVKGKSAIDYLTRNVQQLEAELAEVAQIKTSYRHPRQKMAKDQKQSELTQKLNATRKRLAVAVGTSSMDKGKSGDLDSEYAAQTQELADKRKFAMDMLTKEVDDLKEEIAQIDKTKTANPIKKTANAQKRFEANQKLIAAKKRLELAEQNSNAEQERLKAEYEKKKQATLGNMQTIEKDIATKAADNSAEVRKQAAQALANAVKSRIQRKTSPAPQ